MTAREEEIVGVILAAGRGARMSPLTRTYPKPLLPICNKPMIQYQIEGLREAGIFRIYIVVGHLHKAFEQGLPPIPGVAIEYITQESMLGIAHAVLQLEPLIETPFLLLLGDIFMMPLACESMVEMFRRKRAGAILAARVEDNLEMIKRNFAIVQDGDGRVRRVIEKPRHVPNRLKGCGVYLFDGSVFDAVRRTPRTAMRDEYEITDSIQMFIDDGGDVYVWSDVGWDMNVTQPQDILMCNLMLLRERGLPFLVAEDARVGEGASLELSVVGSGAVVSGTPSIRNSVILPGSRVSGASIIENSLVTPDEILRFPDLELPER